MDLTRRLRRWAVRRPRVLVVDAPGPATLRWTVEAHLDRRRWSPALSPAETDLPLVLSEPGAELARAVDVVWSQVPAPRHRTDISQDDDVAATLDLGVGRTPRRRPAAAVRGADRRRAKSKYHRPMPDDVGRKCGQPFRHARQEQHVGHRPCANAAEGCGADRTRALVDVGGPDASGLLVPGVVALSMN